jgi:hypothetical protein
MAAPGKGQGTLRLGASGEIVLTKHQLEEGNKRNETMVMAIK